MLTEAHVKPVLAIFMLALVGGCATVSSVPSPGIVDGKPSLTTARRTVTFGAFNFLAPPYRDGHRLFAVNRQPNWMSRAMAAARTQGYLFVADEAKNVIDIFPKHHGRSPIGMISNGVASPDGLAVDGASNVYVTNLANATVTVYAPPYTGGPTATYSQALTDPVAVAVGRNGTVYVSNFYSGQVVEYAHHGAKPSRILSIAGAYTEGVALDAQNNLYVGFNGPSGPGDVMKYAPHSSTGTDLGTIVSFCGGLAIDKNDNLLLADQFGNPPAVDVFPPGTTTPSQTIANGFYDPYGVALSGSDLYVVDSSPQQTVQQISYPSGVTVNTIGGFTQALGVAVTKGS